MPTSTTPDLEDRITALEAAQAGNKTDFDAINGRLETLENTVNAIAEGVKTLAPENAAALVAAVADTRAKTNAFYGRVFGDVLFPPEPEPAPVEE